MDFEAEALLTIEEVEGVNTAFSDPVSVPMEASTPLSRQPPSRSMAGMDAGSGPSLTSLAEEQSELLVEILDEIESGGSLGGGSGGGGGDRLPPRSYRPLAQLGAIGTAGFGLYELTQQGTTGKDEPLGPIADLLMNADTEGEAVKNTRKRVYGQEEPPIDAGAIGSDIATTVNETVDFPGLPDLSSATEWPDLPTLSSSAEWPDLPDLSSSVNWPDLPDLSSSVNWPDLPEPSSNNFWPDIPESLDQSGQDSQETSPSTGPGSAVSNARVPGGFENGSPTKSGSLDVNLDGEISIEDLSAVERIAERKFRELKRELEREMQ